LLSENIGGKILAMSKPGAQKTIALTAAEYKVAKHYKETFERLTNCEISWGALIIAHFSGGLSTFAIKGMELSCPQCGERAIIRYVTPKVQPDEDSEEPSPSSSREPTATHKR